MNTTNPSPQASGPSGTPLSLKVGMTSVYAVIFIMGLLGNSIGFRVVCRKTGSRSVANLLIANLAFADLLLTLSIVPYSVVHLHIGSLWFGGVVGHFTCTLVFYFFVVSIAASIITILVVSIDRFYAIFYPLRGRLFRKPKIMSVIIWVSSVLLMSPFLLLYGTYKLTDGRYYCGTMWYWEDDKINYTKTYYVAKIFNILLFVVLYVIPLAIISGLYILIGRRLWVRKIPGNATDSNREAQEKSKRKVIKLLSVIVIVFALFWIPTHVIHYFFYIQPEYLPKIPAAVIYVSFCISHSQCSINPCVYIILNSSFRKDFVKTFKLYSFFERHASRLASTRRESASSSITFVRSMRSIVSLGRSTEYDLPRSTRSVSCSSVVSRASLRKVTPKDTPL